VICPLKDGYYLAVFLDADAFVAAGVRSAQDARLVLDAEI